MPQVVLTPTSYQTPDVVPDSPGLLSTVTNPSVVGTLDALTISGLSIHVFRLLSEAVHAWSPAFGDRHARHDHTPLVAVGVRSGTDHWEVARSYVSIPNGTGGNTSMLTVLGVQLLKRVNHYDSGSSQSTVKYFVSFESLASTTLTAKGGASST